MNIIINGENILEFNIIEKLRSLIDPNYPYELLNKKLKGFSKIQSIDIEFNNITIRGSSIDNDNIKIIIDVNNNNIIDILSNMTGNVNLSKEIQILKHITNSNNLLSKLKNTKIENDNMIIHIGSNISNIHAEFNINNSILQKYIDTINVIDVINIFNKEASYGYYSTL